MTKTPLTIFEFAHFVRTATPEGYAGLMDSVAKGNYKIISKEVQ